MGIISAKARSPKGVIAGRGWSPLWALSQPVPGHPRALALARAGRHLGRNLSQSQATRGRYRWPKLVATFGRYLSQGQVTRGRYRWPGLVATLGVISAKARSPEGVITGQDWSPLWALSQPRPGHPRALSLARAGRPFGRYLSQGQVTRECYRLARAGRHLLGRYHQPRPGHPRVLTAGQGWSPLGALSQPRPGHPRVLSAGPGWSPLSLGVIVSLGQVTRGCYQLARAGRHCPGALTTA